MQARLQAERSRRVLRPIEALQDLNRTRREQVRDPEINSRISAYELAFRMQSAAPELIDLSGETKQTLEMYGVGREDTVLPGPHRGGGRGTCRANS